MEEVRRCPTERAVQQDLSGGADQQIRSPNYFGDPHRGIVRHTRQLIARHIVRSPNYKVAEISAGDQCLCSQLAVTKPDGFAVRDTESPGSSGGERGFSLGSTGSRIERFIVGGVRSAGGLLNVPAGTGTGKKQARSLEPLEDVSVIFRAFALRVRTEWPTDIRALVPTNSQPVEVFQEARDEFRAGPIPIEIVIAEDQRTFRRTGPLGCGPEGSGVAQVQPPCR